jgi:hypothetical protein
MNDDEVRLDQQPRADASDSTAQRKNDSGDRTPGIRGPAEQAPADLQPDAVKATSATDPRAGTSADPGKGGRGPLLSLEIKALTFKQSRWGRVIALLQGAVPVLAILSLVWTVFVGLDQQEGQRKDAESARFERAYTKLGSRLPSERATGVAQASALLRLAGGVRDKDILTALANQLALDEDAAVRSAILNVFSNLDKATGQDALNAALKSIVDLHRVTTQSSGVTPFELATAQPDIRGIYFIPSQTEARAGEVMIDRGALHEMFVRLASLKAAFLSVLKAGGRTQKMDHVYCPGCDFAELGIDLSGVSFQNAILPRSQWRADPMQRFMRFKRHQITAITTTLTHAALLFEVLSARRARKESKRDRTEALALSLVEAEHHDQAKLPPGVLESIKEESTKRQFRFAGCASYLNAGRGQGAPPPSARP